LTPTFKGADAGPLMAKSVPPIVFPQAATLTLRPDPLSPVNPVAAFRRAATLAAALGDCQSLVSVALLLVPLLASSFARWQFHSRPFTPRAGRASLLPVAGTASGLMGLFVRNTTPPANIGRVNRHDSSLTTASRVYRLRLHAFTRVLVQAALCLQQEGAAMDGDTFKRLMHVARMVRLLLPAAVLLAAGAARAEWVKVSETQFTVGYVDPDTITKEGRLRRYWELFDLKVANEIVTSWRNFVEVDCEEGQYRLLQVDNYRGRMATGARVGGDNSPGDWIYIAPNTVGSGIVAYVCAR
jgi:hypothetical protein